MLSCASMGSVELLALGLLVVADSPALLL